MDPLAPTRRVIHVSRKKLIMTIIILAIIAIIFYGGTWWHNESTLVPSDLHLNEIPALPNAPSVGMSAPDISPGYYYGGQPTVNDTREFLKTSYSATIKTRDVPNMVKEIKNAVRDVEGRIDTMDTSDKNGYVSFVVPKAKFEDFRDEIESLAHKKLYVEHISSQNLLGQKQSIEQRTDSVMQSLASLSKQQKDLTDKHNQTVAAIKKELTMVQTELASVRQSIPTAQTSADLTNLRNQETSLVQRETTLKQNQDSENRSYDTSNRNLVAQITQYNSSLENLGKQDTQFTDNIETVNGYISVNWISLWMLLKLFSPIHPSIIIIILLIIIYYILKRRGYLPAVEFV
jgi:hypothetical protein